MTIVRKSLAAAVFLTFVLFAVAVIIKFRTVRISHVARLQSDQLNNVARLLSSGEIDHGMSELRSMAEKGNVKAQLFLGSLYAHRDSFAKPVDYPEAMKWFKRGSSQGLGEGSAAVAELYEQGLGITKSSEAARVWLELAAKQGFDQQELDVRCFTRTVDTERLTCEPWSNGSPGVLTKNSVVGL